MGAVTGLALIALLALPWTRHALEGVMILHMLVQIPLLAVAGALMARSSAPRWRAKAAPWNEGGVSGILMAAIVSSWWMVPRALDGAVASPSMELAKVVSLPLFVGAPLTLSWHRLSGMGRGFVIANVLPMWAVVGWLYVAAPVRVCNYYLVEDQTLAGVGLLTLSAGLALLVGCLAFRGPSTSSKTPGFAG